MLSDETKKIIRHYLGNKYILTLAVFAAWLIFFDRANVVSWIDDLGDVRSKKNQKTHYQKEIIRINEKINELNINDESLEKFARENLYFKNDDEDVFIVDE
jgi:cell division protein FtsB